MIKLDVLVVYSGGTAISAAVADEVSAVPFDAALRQANYNLSYAYFLNQCKKRGITAGLCSSVDVIGSGTCSHYWSHDAGSWKKNIQPAKALQIFDKLSPISYARTEERDLLFSDDAVNPFNDVSLFGLFFDKLKTYQKLKRYSLPTIPIDSYRPLMIRRAMSRLERLKKDHSFSDDFSSSMILKDRYGSGGDHVYKVGARDVDAISTLLMRHRQVQFVLQPFVQFEQGFSYKKQRVATDIRLIISQNELLQCYIRQAQPGDFRCNEHQGGKLEYVTASDVPESVHQMSQMIVEELDAFGSVYALDFVVSNNGQVYFIEGNTGPGLDWDVTNPINERMSKQLIRSIVDELRSRLDLGRIAPTTHSFDVVSTVS
jgi:glutathione synthase/RimK-type ligase-like ATP-grasp enzyme